MVSKRELRQEMKRQKLALTPEARMRLSLDICQSVESLPEFKTAQYVLLYHALPDEVDTAPMLTRWLGRKQLFLPIVKGDDLVIAPYDPSMMKQGAYGIWEPDETNAVSPSLIDLIIVPGVAFDQSRNRLGRGKGYYDRLLTGTTAHKVGIAYDLQLLDSIPAEAHDIPMNRIVTEHHII